MCTMKKCTYHLLTYRAIRILTVTSVGFSCAFCATVWILFAILCDTLLVAAEITETCQCVELRVCDKHILSWCTCWLVTYHKIFLIAWLSNIQVSLLV